MFYDTNFIIKEIDLFKKFIVRFNVIGLAIGTIIGCTSTETMQIITAELIIPIFEIIFQINGFKKYYLYIYSTKINIGLLCTEIIRLIFTLILLFIIYSFINIYANDILEPNLLLEETEQLKKQINETKKLEHINKKTNNIQIDILNELKKLNNK